MRNAQSTGWRSLKPVVPDASDPFSVDKNDLFEAGRIAARALALPASCRFVLDQLCGVYGGEPVENRILVWPSNEFLVERTGIPERSVRFAIARLIAEGVVVAKDSANGKRFAQRAPNGQIIRAYGFDLSPLINRLPELRQRLQAIKDAERERAQVFDELTIHRRAAQEALRTCAEHFPDADISDLLTRALELARRTPRRSATGAADGARDEWQMLRQEAETRYYTACGGNSCRHKDTNKYAPDQSCNNGMEDMQERKRPAPSLNALDLAKACPDAMEFVGPVRDDREFVASVSRLRGGFGVSPSAWDEARREVGPLLAAATLVYVLQMQARPAPGSDPIKNVGGYYRVMIRLLHEGRINLTEEILRLRKKGRPVRAAQLEREMRKCIAGL